MVKKEKITRVLSRWYAALLLLGLPLAYWDGYFDITEVKTALFVSLTVLYLLGRLAAALQFYEPKPLRRLTAGEGAALGLCATALLSSALSGFFWTALTGASARWQGSGMLCLYAAVYFSFYGVELRREEIMFPLAAGMALSGALVIANHLGSDPLGILAPLGPRDAGRYISTLGNINFAGAYFSLALPVCLWGLLTEEREIARCGLGICCLVGLWASMALRSEGVLLGLGAGVLVLPFLLRERPAAFRRWWLLLAAGALAARLYAFLGKQEGATFSILTRVLLRPGVVALTVLAGLGGCLALRRGLAPDRLRRGYAAVLAAGGIALLLILAACNTLWKDADLGPLDDWLHFSEGWGTDRLKVWKYCLGLYGDFSPAQKLFGGGAGVLARLDRVHPVFSDAILDAAHSEYLQILLNWGALGLGAYLGWILAEIRRVGKNAPMLTAGLFAYGIQAAVNIAQAPGIMIFFLLLAVRHGAVTAGPKTGAESERDAGVDETPVLR